MKENKTVNLVLEGGGVKGIGLVGAITELEDQGYSWNYIGGTSAGAIVATLLAVGYTGKELYKIITELDLTEIMDDVSVKEDFFKVEQLVWPSVKKKRILLGLLLLLLKPIRTLRLFLRLKRNHGLFNGEYIVTKVRELIYQKTHKECYTFADLASENGGDESKLSLMVTDITNGRLLILPRDLKDKLNKLPEETEIVEAMRMSMSFPLFFKPKEVSVPQAKPIVLMDGGILSNFPFWYIEGLEEERRKPHPTVGVLLDEGPRNGIKDLSGIIEAILYTMISPLDRMGHRALNDHIVRVNTQTEKAGVNNEISTFAFNLPSTDKVNLYNNGRTAAQEWIQKFEKEILKKEPVEEKMKKWPRQEGTSSAA